MTLIRIKVFFLFFKESSFHLAWKSMPKLQRVQKQEKKRCCKLGSYELGNADKNEQVCCE